MNGDLIRGLRRRIAGRTAGERAAVVREYAQMGGVSVGTVYRHLQAAGWSSGRRRRADRGGHRKDIQAALDAVMAILAKCRWGTPVLNAIEEAELSGLIPTGLVTVSDVARERRRLAVRRVDIRRPAPHVRLASERPNHIHQVDVSACAQWYLETAKDGSIRVLSRKTEVYHNKPREGKPHLLRYVLIDHCSGAFFVRYYLAKGESQANLLDFLRLGWSRKDHPDRFPFCGCPEGLVMDRGSDGPILRNLLASMQIESLPHMPENPRAKGVVESAMWWWEQNFERMTLLKPAVSLEEMNWRAYEKVAWMNARRQHERTGRSRSAHWTEYVGTVRLPPPETVYRALCISAPETRTVTGDLAISFRGRLYSLRGLEGILVRQKVEVIRSAYQDPAVLVRLDQDRPMVLVQPQLTDEHGFPVDAATYGEFKSHKKTATVRHAEAALEAETGTVPRREFLSAIPDRFEVPPPEVHLIPPVSEPVWLPFEARKEAVSRLRDRLERDLTQAEKERIATALQNGGTEKQIAALVAAMGVAPAVVRQGVG